MTDQAEKIRVGVLGASGYSGAELVRLLSLHAFVDIVFLTADRYANTALRDLYPNLSSVVLPEMISIDEVLSKTPQVDFVFCGLPHGHTHDIVQHFLSNPAGPKIIDLSADFRFEDTEVYRKVYGLSHKAASLQKEAVYGLTELARERIRDARLVACPGCYPTTSLLPLVPLIERRLIDPGEIIIDAKSGVTGAGRELKQSSLYSEVAEGIHAYGVAAHRHGGEIEQELSRAAGKKILVNFTPHLVPMNRGILATIYVRCTREASANAISEELLLRYSNEPFVTILPPESVPSTRHVRGSNSCFIGVFEDRLPGRAIILSVTDNLIKGASGQAIQNMNLIARLPETTGLEQLPLFP